MSLQRYLDDMVHWDKDRRYMGATDLTNLILAHSHTLDLSMQKRITHLYLQQLEDSAIEVQGNSVKCLGKIITRFQENLIGEAAGKLSELILCGKAEVRDIYATCLKGILQELSGTTQNIGNLVCQNVLPHILNAILQASNLKQQSTKNNNHTNKNHNKSHTSNNHSSHTTSNNTSHTISNHSSNNHNSTTLEQHLINNSGSSGSIVEECIEVLSEVLKRFGILLYNEYDRILQALLNLLHNPIVKTNLKKKVITCIGILSIHLSDRQMDNLMKILLSNLNLNNIQCISTIARNVQSIQSVKGIGLHIQQIVPLFVQICKNPQQNGGIEQNKNDDRIQQQNKEDGILQNSEIIEKCLSAFEAFIGKVKELSEKWFDILIDLILELISYDPNFYGQDEDMQHDMQQDEDSDSGLSDGYEFDQDSEDEEESWKVRRAAFKVANAMIVGMPHRLEDIFDRFPGPCLQRFEREREANVRTEAFLAIEQLIRGAAATSQISNTPMKTGIVMGGSSDSSIVSAVSTVVVSNPGVQSATPAASSDIPRKLLELIPNLMVSISKQMKAGKSRTQAFALLKVCSTLLPLHVEACLKNDLEDPLLKGLGDSNSAIQLDTLVIFRNLIANYKDARIYHRLAPQLVPQLLNIASGSYSKTASEAFKVLSALLYPLRHGTQQGGANGHANGNMDIHGMSSMGDSSSNGPVRILTCYSEPMIDGNNMKNMEADVPMDDPEAIHLIRQYITPLFEVLYDRMTKNDIDEELKNCSLECFAHLLATTADIFQDRVDRSMGPFVERMRNELTRLTAIRALRTICVSRYIVRIDADTLHQLSEFLCTYLQQTARSLRQISLDCLGQLLRKYGPSLRPNTHLLAVSSIPTFLGDTDLYLTDLAVQVLINAQPSVAVSEVIAQRCIPGILNCCRSPLLQGGALNSILKFFNAISYASAGKGGMMMVGEGGQDLRMLYKKLTEVHTLHERCPTSQAARTVISNIAKCIAALGIVSPFVTSIIQHFIQILQQAPMNINNNNRNPEQIVGSGGTGGGSAENFLVPETSSGGPDISSSNDPLLIELALLSLGEMGKFLDLAASPAADLLNQASNQASQSGQQSSSVQYLIFQQLDSDNEDVSQAAAIALGYIAMGSREFFLGVLIDRLSATIAGSSSDDGDGGRKQYLLLIAFREVISLDLASDSQKRSLLEPNLPQILRILQEHASSEEDGIRNLVSECLGHLLLIPAGENNSTTLELIELLKGMINNSSNPKCRATGVSAIKHAALKGCRIETLKLLKPSLLKTLEDVDILQVRRAGMQSISALLTTHNNYKGQVPSDYQNNVIISDSAEYICKICLEEGKIRQELIREVDLGPFKHRVDDGLPIRKLSYSLMGDLLAIFAEKVVKLLSESAENTIIGGTSSRLIQFLVEGLSDHDDVISIVCGILGDLSQNFWITGPLVAQLDKLIDPLERGINKNCKQIQCKQQLNKSTDMLRTYARAVKSMQCLSSHKTFADFFGRIQKDPIFLNCYSGLE